MEENWLSDEYIKNGYVFSLRKTILYYMLVYGGLLFLGRLFLLHFYEQLCLCVVGLSFLPFYIRNSDKNQYDQKQFSDLNKYMEQFLYSFMKTGKILATLEDLSCVFEKDDLGAIIAEAREYILKTEEETAEKNALLLIENEYENLLLSLIHKFCLRAEVLEGNYRPSLTVLLEYRKDWAEEVFCRQREKRRKRMYTGIAVVALIVLMYRNPLSEIRIVGVLLLCFFAMYLGDLQLGMEYAYREKGLSKEKETETERMFFEWAMMLVLYLQRDSVQVAIHRSYDDAPEDLKPRLKQLINKLRENPDGLEPYLAFLNEYSLPEVHAFMRMLYAIS